MRQIFMRAAGLMILISLTFLLVSRQSAVAQQESDGQATTVILALEHEWVEGQSRNDNNALNLIFDNALVYVEYGRLVTKGEYLSCVKQGPSQLSEIVLEPTMVHVFGGTAVAVGTYRERRLKRGQTGLKRWRFVDTWVHKKNGWMLVAAAAAPLAK
jgi:hypothetical protein